MRVSSTLSLLLTVILCLPAFGNVPAAAKRFPAAHASEHWIVTGNDIDEFGCTATAIAPHALLTAEHCDFKGVDEDGNSIDDGSPVRFWIDPVGRPDYAEPTPYTIIGKEFDGADHMILLVSGPAFKNVMPIAVGQPYQGESVAWFGNPAGIRDQFREGYVTGVEDAPVPFQVGTKPLWIVAASAIPGDSGSSVFDARTGAIVGLVTYGINGGMFAGIFPLQFTAGQYAVAQAYQG